MSKIGVVHGRFQPLHWGHMEYIKAAKNKCEYLIVGITNPDPTTTKYDPADPKRSLPFSNPFTFFERFTMIKDTLLDEGFNRNEFDIVPFPINCPELLKYYVPIHDSVFYITIYDEWGWKKKTTLESIGAHVEVLWVRSMSERFTTGQEVRRRIAEGKEWKHLVPHAVYEMITKWKLDRRIQEIFNKVEQNANKNIR